MHNIVIEGFVEDNMKQYENKFDIAIADPEAGWSINTHFKWMSAVIKMLKEDGKLFIVGHPIQRLFGIHTKKFLMYTKKEGGGFDIFIIGNNISYREAIEILIAKNSKKDDMVLDCFSGKGTTSIVAKKLRRNSVAMEKDSIKCDKIREVLNENISGK